jgi:hypothetical protein
MSASNSSVASVRLETKKPEMFFRNRLVENAVCFGGGGIGDRARGDDEVEIGPANRAGEGGTTDEVFAE